MAIVIIVMHQCIVRWPRSGFRAVYTRSKSSIAIYVGGHRTIWRDITSCDSQVSCYKISIVYAFLVHNTSSQWLWTCYVLLVVIEVFQFIAIVSLFVSLFIFFFKFENRVFNCLLKRKSSQNRDMPVKIKHWVIDKKYYLRTHQVLWLVDQIVR